MKLTTSINKLLMLTVIFYTIIPLPTTASGRVIINEIAWMGTTASANDEWIELYNPTDSIIDLTGWTLKATVGTLNINLKGSIPAQGYYLLERTDDQTVSQITADLIYTGALSNTGKELILRDQLGNIIDDFNQSSGWRGGNNTTKQTLERTGLDNTNWHTSLLPNGTPKTKNSSPANKPTAANVNSLNNQIKTSNTNKSNTNTTVLELDEVKKLSSRTKVLTQGYVAVKPGIFGRDLFLAGSGLQLTLSQGEWPELNIGDLVSARGAVSQTISYGSRLLVKTPIDISLIESKAKIPKPINLKIKDLTNSHAGWLISLTGEISKIDKKSLTLTQDGQSIKIVLKYNGSWPNIKKGNQITANGFLVVNNNEFKLWPRQTEDVIIDQSTPERVAGIQDVNIPKKSTSNLLGYFFIAAAVLIIIIGYWWEKRKAKKNTNVS